MARTKQTTAVTTNLPLPTDHDLCNDDPTGVPSMPNDYHRKIPEPRNHQDSADRQKDNSQNIFAKIRENISYANALKGDHKMAPPPEQTSNKSNETHYPSLLELGKKLRQAQGDETRCLLSSSD
ncbi:hypothetical protein TNIN_253891 [Trichonephila inaurata madagascariensis]|uniref:Uncharacterized protein n=1 Tax=Trichonephila inaurata madagascariensis TaxID=2747483 RepID=A0A8X7CIQ6_9ARAC|nr:hypothetical protein TNIN_253891 [Trichonephila inaurata madagascariensis]